MTLKNSKKQEEISSTKLSIPTAGALEYRTTMYPVGKKPELSTVYGEVWFEKGQLSSRDRDYIDAIMAHAEKARINPAGELAVVFDAAKVRRSLGFSTKTNWYKLYQRLVDIKSIKLSIRRPDDDWPTSFSLISSVSDSKTQTNHGSGKFETKMKKVIFTRQAVALMLDDTRLYLSRPLIIQVLSLCHQISRAVARWCLSHSNTQHPLISDILVYVGASGCNDRMKRRYVAQLREDAGGLAKIGITLSHDRVHYYRNQSVFIEVAAACSESTETNPEAKIKSQNIANGTGRNGGGVKGGIKRAGVGYQKERGAVPKGTGC